MDGETERWYKQQKKVLAWCWWGVGSRTEKIIWNHDIQRAVNARLRGFLFKRLILRGASTPRMDEIQEAPEKAVPWDLDQDRPYPPRLSGRLLRL